MANGITVVRALCDTPTPPLPGGENNSKGEGQGSIQGTDNTSSHPRWFGDTFSLQPCLITRQDWGTGSGLLMNNTEWEK